MSRENIKCCPLCDTQLFWKQENYDHILECKKFNEIEPIAKSKVVKNIGSVLQPCTGLLHQEKINVTKFLTTEKQEN
jgi:hypothetical protein